MTDTSITYWKAFVHVDFAQFLKKWPWEWFSTLTFPVDQRYGPDVIKAIRFRWTRNLCIKERIQVAYYYLLASAGDYFHLHLLMLGRGRVSGIEKTLANVSKSYWERQWYFFARNEIPESRSRVVDYVSDHLRKPGSVVDDDFYNIKLLKKLKREQFNMPML